MFYTLENLLMLSLLESILLLYQGQPLWQILYLGFYQQMIFFGGEGGSQSLFDGNTVSGDYWFLNVGSSLLLHELLTSSKLRGLNALFINLDFSCVLWSLSYVLWSLVFIEWVKCLLMKLHGFPWVCEWISLRCHLPDIKATVCMVFVRQGQTFFLLCCGGNCYLSELVITGVLIWIGMAPIDSCVLMFDP